MRPLQDYHKVRSLVSWLLRNRAFQSSKPRLESRQYLQIGCGPQIASGFVNLDYRWVPGVDVVWDLNRSLPFPPNRFQGIFTEHCMEHFNEGNLRSVLLEMYRVLRPGGRVRIVVPSLEIHARRYLDTRSDSDAGPAIRLNQAFYSGHDNMGLSRWTHDGHHFMHDFATLANQLQYVGFDEIAAASFNGGGDPFLLIDRADRAWESLYVEGVKSN